MEVWWSWSDFNFDTTYSSLYLYTHMSIQGRCVILRDRKLNIAPAIKKQTFCAPNETIYYAATAHPGLINNIPIEQFQQALYSPGEMMIRFIFRLLHHRTQSKYSIWRNCTTTTTDEMGIYIHSMWVYAHVGWGSSSNGRAKTVIRLRRQFSITIISRLRPQKIMHNIIRKRMEKNADEGERL